MFFPVCWEQAWVKSSTARVNYICFKHSYVFSWITLSINHTSKKKGGGRGMKFLIAPESWSPNILFILVSFSIFLFFAWSANPWLGGWFCLLFYYFSILCNFISSICFLLWSWWYFYKSYPTCVWDWDWVKVINPPYKSSASEIVLLFYPAFQRLSK